MIESFRVSWNLVHFLPLPFLLNCHDSVDDEYVDCITPDTSKRQLFADGKEGGEKDKHSV